VGDATADRLLAIANTEEDIREMIDGRAPFNHHRMDELLATLKSLDPLHTLFCLRHSAHAADLGACNLGPTMNSRGEYGWYAPSCTGCHYGREEEEQIRAAAEEPPLAGGAALAAAPTGSW
jgi:hypothetical protein